MSGCKDATYDFNNNSNGKKDTWCSSFHILFSFWVQISEHLPRIQRKYNRLSIGWHQQFEETQKSFRHTQKYDPFILELKKVVFLLKGMGMWNLHFFFFTSVICITEKAKERTGGFDKGFIRATVFIVYQIVNRPRIFLKRGGAGEFEQLAMQKACRLAPSLFFEMAWTM